MKKAQRLEAFVESLTSATPDTPNPHYLGYFLCFNRGDYYEAHDVLEHLWLKTRDSNHSFYKALIQLAGAFVHLKLHHLEPEHPVHGRRLAPALRLFKLASRNLSAYESPHMNLDLNATQHLINHFSLTLESSSPASNPWDPAHLPQLNPDGLGKPAQTANLTGSHD